MQFTSLITASLLSVAALAAPTERAAAVSMAANNNWTFKSFTRTCNQADTSCKVSFGIQTNTGGKDVPCSYTVTGSPASRAPANGITCGGSAYGVTFGVSSGWSGQFGAGNGFTTWAVNNGKQIAYPSYSDKDLVNGKAVSPDRSFPAQNLPSR